jgi:hypothetical protein
VNVATGDVHGLQTAAGVSLAGSLSGAQISVINIGGDVDGAQIGVINLARSVKGLQLGVVNLSSELEGAPIGIVNVIGNGQFHVQAFSSDVTAANVAVKYGGKSIYTLAAVGYQPGEGKNRLWLSGLGLGGHIALDRFYVDVDGMGWGGGSDAPWGENRLLLSQLRCLGGFELASRFAVFGGVTGNVLIEWKDQVSRTPSIDALPKWEKTNVNNRLFVWPGLVAGVQI